MNPDNVRRFIETEYDCEVTDLHVKQWFDSYKVDGTVWQRGKKGIAGGNITPQNFSGVKVCWIADDNPFEGL